MSKLEAAKAYLGDNWVGHPDYTPRARHSTNPRFYAPARQPYLHQVSTAAAEARARNPFFNKCNKEQ